MTYTEMKKKLENVELSIRAEMEFNNLSESSSQEELDKFMRRHRNLFEVRSEEQEAFEEYKRLRAVESAILKEEKIDFFALANNILTDNSESTDDTYLSEIRHKMDELYPLAKKYAEWCRTSLL